MKKLILLLSVVLLLTTANAQFYSGIEKETVIEHFGQPDKRETNKTDDLTFVFYYYGDDLITFYEDKIIIIMYEIETIKEYNRQIQELNNSFFTLVQNTNELRQYVCYIYNIIIAYIITDDKILYVEGPLVED